MAEILETDAYNPNKNTTKFCSYCKDPVARGNGSSSVGLCQRHLDVWREDVQSGFKRNRLKDLIDQYNNAGLQEPEGLPYLKMNCRALTKRLSKL